MKKPVPIQVHALGKGLAATLIQDDGPVTFTSKVRGNYSPVSLVQNVSGHMFFIDTS